MVQEKVYKSPSADECMRRSLEYSLEEFDSFIRGIKKMSTLIQSEKPDYIFAPVIGSVPFIDLLFIVDRHFPLGIVEYPPNSSRFSNREELIERWYKNFLEKNYSGEKMKIINIDEVISGSSAVKGYTEFMRELNRFSKERKELKIRKKIKYKVIGIGEQPQYGGRTPPFTTLRNSNKLYLIDTKKILTADNIFLNPIRLKICGEHEGRHIYLPEIERFEATKEYMNLLCNAATYVGKDPSSVSPQNFEKIQESLSKYLS